MPGRRGTLGLACVAAAMLAGCGSENGGEKIPPADAEEMKALAGEIEAATGAQECDVAQSTTTELRASVEGLPEETDTSIVDALNAMITRVDDQLDEECTETGTSEPTTTTEPETTEVTPTTTTPPETTTTTTTAPEEGDEDEEEPETQEQPPEEGGGPNGPPATPPGQSGGGPPTGGLEEDDG